MKRIAIYLFSVLLLCSCDRDLIGFFMPPSDDVEKRFEQSMQWNDEHGYPVINVPSQEYTFYCATDVHVRGSNDNISTFITRLRNDEEAVFGILLGDLVHDTGYFPLLMEAFEFDPDIHAQNDTVFSTVGNHDLYFGQWTEYKKYWRTSCLYITVQMPGCYDLYLVLDSGSGTLGHSQTEWAKSVLAEKAEGARHIIVCTHTNLLRIDNTSFPSGGFTTEETFELTSLMQQYGVDLCLQGHNHTRHESFYRDVRYVIIETVQDSAERPGYLEVTAGESLELEFIDEL